MLPTPPASPALNGYHTAPEDRIGHVLGNWIQLTGVLGVGAYGVVYNAVDLRTRVPYAVKALNKVGLEPRQKRFQQREIELHYQASQHPNVVSLVKVFDSPDTTYVVLEFCPEGDLFSSITEKGKYVGNDVLARSIFLQILSAVESCHGLGIYHRDLKPENILVSDYGMTVKLADFGLATTDKVTSDFGCGSTFYMSPECQQSQPKPYASFNSAANDIWSLGVVLVNLTCGRNPWKRACLDDSTFKAYVRDRSFLRTILPLSAELNNILARIFELDPMRRPSIQELREMILRCPQFTTASAPLVPLIPQFSPMAYNHDVFPNNAQAPEFIPVYSPLPSPISPIVAPVFDGAEQRLSQMSDSSFSSNSDAGSVFSDISSTSSTSSVSSTAKFTIQPRHVQQYNYPAQLPGCSAYKAAAYFNVYQHTVSAPLHVY